MKLKKAILDQMSRDQLKAACHTLKVADVDFRSVDSMRAKLSRSRSAEPETLFRELNEHQIKLVAEALGKSSTGRRKALIEMLLREVESDDKAKGSSSVRDAAHGREAHYDARPKRRRARPSAGEQGHTEQYRHGDEAVQRPDVGIQDQFQARKPPKTYRYDSSLDPALAWDEQRERDLGEWLLGLVERAATDGEEVVFAEAQVWKGGGVTVGSTKDVVNVLKQISKPFLNWTGKAERHEISVPTVPLFVHERHSTKAILDGISHRKAKGSTLDLFGDPAMDIRDQLEAYEHKGPWQNRMILGDSLSVMNSLLEFEGLGGQVQMIYIDPPYGVKFGSNFQPFVRKRDVKHGGDEDMTREPEMVRAYRDTWELGLHSYLSYLRDRLLVARDLLADSGSVFVQISDENIHHVRELLDEVFGAENFCSIVSVKKTSGLGATLLQTTQDFILWYGKNRRSLKYHQLYVSKLESAEVDGHYLKDESDRLYTLSDLTGQNNNVASCIFEYDFEGKRYRLPPGRQWKTTRAGIDALVAAGRIQSTGRSIRFKRFADDFPFSPITDTWHDIGGSVQSRSDPKIYVVQTGTSVLQRCVLMSTDPGDLVVDPTCGSGTTALVAERWGRRWITIDTSRVPMALARQRLLTATFPYYQLKAPGRGPAGGFVYELKQSSQGEYAGGLVPRITLKSFSKGEVPSVEVLVDRPEVVSGVTRVTGPFVIEASVAPSQVLDFNGESNAVTSDAAAHVERMTEVLRRSKTLRLPGNRELTLAGIRRTVDTDYLHAEGQEGDKRVALVFGPQDGAISASLVYESGREAHYLKYHAIYFFGFAVEPNARVMIEDVKKLRIPAVYVAVTPDVAMSDLLKTTRSSEIFSITGLPDFEVRKLSKKGPEGQDLWQVELKGLDIFDPESLATDSVDGQSVPCWMLDTDYDGMSFYASQVFFPKTSAWDNLQKSLKATFDESVWEHLAGTVSEPFALGETRRVAVKVIDERGNELLRVMDVTE